MSTPLLRLKLAPNQIGAAMVQGLRQKATFPASLTRQAIVIPSQRWPILLGYALLLIPTLISLAQQSWDTEFGAHGPLVLATGLWLLGRRLHELRERARPGNAWIAAVMLGAALPLYSFGRAYDFLSLEVAGLYGAGLALLYLQVGTTAMRLIWFPLVYLAFVIPPPVSLIDEVTAPLKAFISAAITDGLRAFGVPIVRQGVTLFVAQYQLLVADACSGINSLTGMVAISLLYIYLLHNASWRYALLLTTLVIPIAILANIVRIVILVLLTLHAGDAVAQGFLHFAAGITLFMSALLLVFAIDSLLARLRSTRST